MFLSFLLLVISLTSICEAQQGKILPAGPFHIVDGDAVTVTCTWKGKEKAPDIKFKDMDNDIEVQSTKRLTIIYKKDEAKNTTTGTFTWNPIYVTDKLKSVSCKNIDTSDSKSFHIFVLKKSSIPNITISDGNTIYLKKGENRNITCIISYVKNDKVKKVGAIWSLSSSSQVEPPKNAKAIEKSSGTTITSQLQITSADLQNEKTYYCIVTFKYEFVPLPVWKHNKSIKVKVNITNGIKSPEEKLQSSKEEVVVFAGKTASLDCRVSGNPLPKVKWMKSDKIINDSTDNRYSFKQSTAKDSPLNTVLTIKNIAFADRSIYTCVATFRDRNVTITRVYTLRVRDTLGALWPVLGMFIEAVLLIIVIAACEKFGKKKHGKKTFADDDGDAKDVIDGRHTSEAAPLVDSERTMNTLNA